MSDTVTTTVSIGHMERSRFGIRETELGWYVYDMAIGMVVGKPFKTEEEAIDAALARHEKGKEATQ